MSEEKRLSIWEQFVLQKADWIGGTLEDFGDGIDRQLVAHKAVTIITDLTVKIGDDSQYFEVCGKEFNCGFDSRFGGVTGGTKSEVHFIGWGGHEFRMIKA